MWKWAMRAWFVPMLLSFNVSAHPYQKMELLKYVELSGGRILRCIDDQLTLIQHHGRQQTIVRVPDSLDKALKSASSIVFPTTHSRIIGADEYVLMVVNHCSHSARRRNCSVNEEGILYALRLRGETLDPTFSLMVQSYKQDIKLDKDPGQASRYDGITWTINPIGIQINWANHGDWLPEMRRFRYADGAFVPSRNGASTANLGLSRGV
jgi:hypothetical protein